MHKTIRKHFLTIAVITMIFGIGILMRFYNLNWDNGNLFHPDERNIANAVTKIIFFSQLNPQFFAYGGFSLYMYRFAADIIEMFTHDPGWIANWGMIDIIGRTFSAFFASLTLIPLYFLAKDVFNRQTAFLSCLLYAFSVIAIQIAHFATTESLLTAEGVLLGFLGIRLYHAFSWKKIIIIAVIFGISIATKTTAVSFALFPVLAIILGGLQKRVTAGKTLTAFLLFAVLSLGVFVIFSPYTFLDYKDFLASMQYESAVATGSLPVVYTLQFNGSIPYLFQLYNFFWQIGLIVPFSILGVFLTIFLFYRTQHYKYLLFLSFPLVYFFYVGSWHTKFIRYMLPFLPFFVIMGSAFLVWLQKHMEHVAHIIMQIVVVTTVFWAIAFFTIYTRPQTRVAASTWIYQHIPPGKSIMTEQWDDGLPIDIGTDTAQLYPGTSLAMYDPDNASKLFYLTQNLAQHDYLILNSRRIYGTLIRLTKEYPLTSFYYRQLFDGKLGYSRVAVFSSYPSLFGLTIPDDTTEETFQVYDHPKVIIFENTKHYPQQYLSSILGAKIQ